VNTKECKERARLAKLGDKNPNWKEDDVGMSGLHCWINRNKPKPESGLCEVCNINPFRDAACITGIYNRDFENWKYTCHSCNIKSDFENGTRSLETVFRPPLSKNNPIWHNSNLVCQFCGLEHVIRVGTQKEMQNFRCKDCKKNWRIKKSLLEQYYNKIRDSKNRCYICNRDKTQIKHWRMLDGQYACIRCYSRETRRRKNHIVRPPYNPSTNDRVCFICNMDGTQFKGTWRILDGRYVCVRCYARVDYRRKKEAGRLVKAVSMSPLIQKDNEPESIAVQPVLEE
jgi:hypothetical protein